MTLPDDHNNLLEFMRENLESDSEREWRERAEAAEGEVAELKLKVRDLERQNLQLSMDRVAADRRVERMQRAQECARRHREARRNGQTSLDVGVVP